MCIYVLWGVYVIVNTKYIKPMIDPQIVDIPIPGEPVSLLSALQTAPSSLRS
jgi:hypothetical protein